MKELGREEDHEFHIRCTEFKKLSKRNASWVFGTIMELRDKSGLKIRFVSLLCIGGHGKHGHG